MTIFHYVNGKIVPDEKAGVHVLNLGLLRGYGVFDYAQTYGGRPFHLRAHIERLQRSAEEIGLNLPMSIDEIEQVAWDLIEYNEPIDAGVRFLVTGTLCGKDILQPGDISSLTMLFHPFTPLNTEAYTKGFKAVTTKHIRYMPHVKSINYMPTIFAMKEAVAKGADDALHLNDSGGIIEATTSNVFFVKNGKLITDDSNQLVKGVTREIILNLAQKEYPIEYRTVHLSEFSTYDEAFLTSSAKDLVPLVEIDGIAVGNGSPGPISDHLRRLYHNYIEEYFRQNFHLKQATV